MVLSQVGFLGMLLSFLLDSRGPNPALNPAPFSRWTLRDKAAQRRLALRSSALRADERGASCRTSGSRRERRRTLVRATRLRRYARLGYRALRALHPRAGVAQLAPR